MAMDVRRLVQQLGQNKVLNPEITLGQLLNVEGIGLHDPGGVASDYVAAWDHYVVICGARVQTLGDIGPMAKSIRASLGSGAGQPW
jgi:hypothetical protein